mmetsp:Transcript_21805/g.60596  ORF Transcript_21805/g.60596 Transcript_21805/m.60596 type:complete len:413 (-) Transcript_21805:324-1562(-)|eukprot:CAMPEP_0117682918 /NCGR_PEP_ID=MMETSP0804-20121206/20016_1 /TAXON_ID=1074897 /ORGANISM="Tetraselmis astigmatica, Strain CCMP880" /LENGTH=412 /DNA_ID=CAMNT_0005493263 /DNA_START=212 /DNA_END=1450 /DNA_ORIENTATION=-
MSSKDEDGDDDGVVEHDPIENRYARYSEQIGQGRFKTVYRGFDERLGLDVAWAKISGLENDLTEAELEQVLCEVRDGQKLVHPHVVNYYLAWADYENQCINFITELFTSGNLRDYRTKHKHLGIKALKKWARQLLDGLHYLHTQADGPLVHGDLRCDKIYISGHTGGIKIGDLGLATLLERRYKEKAESGDYSILVQQSKTLADVYCFGLCMLELVTLQPLDPVDAATKWEDILETVEDKEAKRFIRRCLAPDGPAPTAMDLMQDPFLEERNNSLQRAKSYDVSQRGLSDVLDGDETPSIPEELKSALGSIRGDEWHFTVKGVQRSSGILSCKLVMKPTDEGDEAQAAEPSSNGTGGEFALQFDYDPSKDDPQVIVEELAVALPELGRRVLSSIDRDMCVSALKECINGLLL